MPSTGSITLYSTARRPVTAILVRSLLAVVEAPDVRLLVRRTRREEHEWRAWRRQARPTPPWAFWRLAGGIGAVLTTPDADEEFVHGRHGVEAAARAAEGRRFVRLSLDARPLGVRLQAALDDHIPAALRGEFRPCEPWLAVGGHDIFECAESPRGRYFGRAHVSFQLVGRGSPPDWTLYRAMALEAPAIRELRERLETVVGRVQTCVYWDP